METDRILDTKEVLREYISKELLNGYHTVGDEDNLLLEGMLDSLGVISLVTFIEKEFEIRVPEEDILIENFRTVRVIANYVEKRCMER